jgi:HSP20 family protein
MSNLTIRDPFVPSPFRGVFDRFFDEPFFRGFPTFASFVPVEATLPVDISERDGQLVVEASLPGFKKEEVDVKVHDGVLTVQAERKQETEERTEKFYRRERSWGSVSRRVSLPAEVDEGAVDAELKNGVLTVRLGLPVQRVPKSVDIRGE